MSKYAVSSFNIMRKKSLLFTDASLPEFSENPETKYQGFYVIGDGSGVTHSLSHASASGTYVA